MLLCNYITYHTLTRPADPSHSIAVTDNTAVLETQQKLTLYQQKCNIFRINFWFTLTLFWSSPQYLLMLATNELSVGWLVRV